MDYKLGVSPDEYWSEERLEKWKEDMNKRDKVEEVLEKVESFINTNNNFTDFTSIKLKGWNEGDPF